MPLSAVPSTVSKEVPLQNVAVAPSKGPAKSQGPKSTAGATAVKPVVQKPVVRKEQVKSRNIPESSGNTSATVGAAAKKVKDTGTSKKPSPGGKKGQQKRSAEQGVGIQTPTCKQPSRAAARNVVPPTTPEPHREEASLPPPSKMKISTCFYCQLLSSKLTTVNFNKLTLLQNSETCGTKEMVIRQQDRPTKAIMHELGRACFLGTVVYIGWAFKGTEACS